MRGSGIARREPQNYCNRCGFPLRFVDGRLWCDNCRVYPLDREIDVSSFLSQIEGRLRRTLTSLERRLGGETEDTSRNVYPQAIPPRPSVPPPRVTVTTPMRTEPSPSTGGIDDRVFSYIEAHNGEISLSKASSDIGIALNELQEAVERLRNSGRLALQNDQTNVPSPPAPLSRKVCVNCSRLIAVEARYCTNCGYVQPTTF